VGLLAEDHMPNKTVGPTMHAVLKVQFERLRDGDFYYYENDPELTYSDIGVIDGSILSKIIRRNSTLSNSGLQRRVFKADPCPLKVDKTMSNSGCGGDGCDGQFEVIPSGGAAPYTIEYRQSGSWSPTDGTEENLCHGIYKVRITDATGHKCTELINLKSSANLSLRKLIHTSANCGGGDATVWVIGRKGVPPYEYAIDNDAYQASGRFSSLAAGTYNISVKDQTGCEYTQEVTVEASTGLELKVTKVYDACSNGSSGNGKIKVKAYGAHGAARYSIDNGATFQYSRTFKKLAPGTYTILAKDWADCTDSIEATVESNGCKNGGFEEILTAELEGLQVLNVYPNPTTGQVKIDLATDMSVNVNINIRSIDGRIVYTQNVPSVDGDFTQFVDLSQVTAGLYFVEVRTVNQHQVQKLIIK